MTQTILIDGKWIPSKSPNTFQATDPSTGSLITTNFPVSNWDEIDAALESAVSAFEQLANVTEEQIAVFLETFANRIESRASEICEIANQETGLPISPRLADIELPRTTNQLRQAAQACRSASWCRPTIDTKTNIRSVHGAIGPVAVFGPNNFPLAFGSISGGDFAAAIAAGNPVIAKANSSHPATTQILAEEAQAAAEETGMPAAMVQLIYRTSHADGEKMVADSRLAAVGYTGSRNAGLKLKRIADEVGKPIYLELSSINPIAILPGAIEERGEELAQELAGSCLMGTGQFCTSPGLILLLENGATEQFVQQFSDAVEKANTGILLSRSVQSSLTEAMKTLTNAGAEILHGGQPVDSDSVQFANTVLRVSGKQFLDAPEALQTEAFGNASLIVTAADLDQAKQVLHKLEGNLTGCIYSHSENQDDEAYDCLATVLRQKVGRLLNDKMPTGVAVSSAMNHGGPFPATGHPGFTAVGMPDSIIRFSMLQCFDNVRLHRLPGILRDENANQIVRRIDGEWTKNAVQ